MKNVSIAYNICISCSQYFQIIVIEIIFIRADRSAVSALTYLFIHQLLNSQTQIMDDIHQRNNAEGKILKPSSFIIRIGHSQHHNYMKLCMTELHWHIRGDLHIWVCNCSETASCKSCWFRKGQPQGNTGLRFYPIPITRRWKPSLCSILRILWCC